MGLWADVQKFVALRREEMLVRSAAIGLDSTVDAEHDRHIVMLDYDIQELPKVIDSVEEVQEFWNLADALVFRTRHGFHVLFFNDIVPYGRVRQIVEFARDVDPLFKSVSYVHQHKTLRVAGKYPEQDVEFVGIIPGVRRPSKEERMLGEMKRKEHALLLKGSAQNAQKATTLSRAKARRS